MRFLKKNVCLCFAALRPIMPRKDWRHISKVLLLKKSSQCKSSVDFVPLDANKLGPRYFRSISFFFFLPSMKAFLERIGTRACAAPLSRTVAFLMLGRMSVETESFVASHLCVCVGSGKYRLDFGLV